ncbi:MAG: hypothetical protein OCD03_03100 [Hyphomicrobiales bacterium]
MLIDLSLGFVSIWLIALPCFALRPFLKTFNKKRFLTPFFQLFILIVVSTIAQVILADPLIAKFSSPEKDVEYMMLGVSSGLISAGILLYWMIRRDKRITSQKNI